MRSRTVRTLLAGTGVVVALAALAGCTKPSPGASVFSGTVAVNTEAMCWSDTADAIDSHTCAEDMVASATSGKGAASVAVVPGDVIGISVDPAVADAGWSPVIGGNPIVQAPLHSTYFRFTYPELQPLPEGGLPLMIVAGDANNMRGIWAYVLTPASE